MKAIAVIDLSTLALCIYDVNDDMDSEEIEEFIHGQGHHLSNCSWGEFDGEINDYRN